MLRLELPGSCESEQCGEGARPLARHVQSGMQHLVAAGLPERSTLAYPASRGMPPSSRTHAPGRGSRRKEDDRKTAVDQNDQEIQGLWPLG